MNKNLEFSQIHKEIYFHVKRKALSFESDASLDFNKYKNDHQRFSQRSLSKSNINELINSIAKSRVVFLGDFHAFEQSTRNMRRILSNIIKKQNNLAIGLECIHKDSQKLINQLLKEEISEEIFLKKTKYMTNWRYPWPFYKYFFDLAKQYNLPILALNTKGTLPSRDVEAAKSITSFVQKNPQTTLFVVFGEYHITPDKLPLQVRIRQNTSITSTIVHQNLDYVFWKYQKEFLHKQQIFKFNENEFTLQSSPPWIKYESIIHWYESMLDDPRLDLHESQSFFPFSHLSENSGETFLDFAQKISQVLSIQLTKDELSDFNLYDQNNIKNILKHLRKIENSACKNFYLRLLTRSKTFKIPFRNDYYCPSYSINRIAYLAGIHVLHQQHLKIKSNYELTQLKNNQEKKFYLFLYRHLIAFLSSKIINPFRKCDYYVDIKEKLNALHPINDQNKHKKSYLTLTLAILDDWNNIDVYIKKQPLKILSSVAKLTGYLLAEYLFEEIMHKNKAEFDQILKIIIENQSSKEHFVKVVATILKDIDYKKQKKRFF
ncbi:MAG: hypothetical protein A2202_04875 [Bdellovibrionales bacterium RIFOXYA1_FULL_36_14]|nr:MAG: hypothetical protein A2202_04875 [Bdellovibrionales bacterium RIFOXYA1_FULL_36_14]